MRDFGGQLSLNPHLPAIWDELSFSLRFRGRQLRIKLGHQQERYSLDSGHPLEVLIRDQPRILRRGEPLVVEPPVP